jgi:hypothetical protein
VDGENISLMGSRFFGLENVTLSGTQRGNVLTLTGTQAIPVTFARSSMTAYQAQVSELNARSQGTIRARAAARVQMQAEESQRSFIAAIDQLLGRMLRFNSEADVHLGRFPGAERGYQAITAKIAADVARERELARNPNAFVTRSQLSVPATQTSLLMDQMHYQTQSLESSMKENIQPVVNELGTLERGCRNTLSNSNNLPPAQIQARDVACGRLGNAAIPFRQKFDATTAGLVHLEQVYQGERSRQQRLLREGRDTLNETPRDLVLTVWGERRTTRPQNHPEFPKGSFPKINPSAGLQPVVDVVGLPGQVVTSVSPLRRRRT